MPDIDFACGMTLSQWYADDLDSIRKEVQRAEGKAEVITSKSKGRSLPQFRVARP
jgi:hypothetical protein